MTKKATPEYSFEISDYDYKNAINYTGTNYLNAPITVTIDSVKYILPFGQSDRKNLVFKYGKCYIIGENEGLNYMSFVEIDLKEKIVLSIYVESNQIDDKESIFYRIIGRTTATQIKKFLKYMSY
jgi:hypothetical protein